MKDRTTWRTSSFSADGSECVQVPGTLDRVRDSKNPGGPILPTSTGGFAQLVTYARAR